MWLFSGLDACTFSDTQVSGSLHCPRPIRADADDERTPNPSIHMDTQMLKLSEILVANQDIESFDELIPLVQAVARSGERFFRMDVKPPYPDTPENWEDRLEAAFSGLLR